MCELYRIQPSVVSDNIEYQIMSMQFVVVNPHNTSTLTVPDRKGGRHIEDTTYPYNQKAFDKKYTYNYKRTTFISSICGQLLTKSAFFFCCSLLYMPVKPAVIPSYFKMESFTDCLLLQGSQGSITPPCCTIF